ncbi:AMP-dependent synthetase/ligase [Streptomyces sp. NPDC017979]|uniref:AMP-dependent synthetase/ligase n=1 Tax=Streptomyces sp. NPDC017979 TaxID=3365024 RepID=UPI00379F4926
MLSPGQVQDAGSLCAVFQATVAARPDEVAVRSFDGSTSITWREYDRRVRRIAAGLAGIGVRRGSTVAMMLTNRPEFNLLDAAVMHLGASSFSIYNTYPPEQIAFLFAAGGNRVVVCEEQFLAKVRAAAVGTAVERVVCLDGGDEDTLSLEELESAPGRGFDFDAAWRAVTRNDLLTLIFTSGTTGRPKGVELTHANVLFSVGGSARLQQEVFGADHHGHVISYLPDANLANRWSGHYVPMASGATVTTVRDGRTVTNVLKDVHPTMFMGVPMIWYKLKAAIEQEIAALRDERRALAEWALGVGAEKVRLELAGSPVPPELAAEHERATREFLAPLRASFGLDRLGYTTSGGAPISPEALEFYLSIGLPLYEVYGMTECAASGIANSPGHMRLGTVGKPKAGMEIRLGDDGELLIRSPGVMRGYRNDPARTAEAVDADGWLHTGDIATIDADGFVSIVDRKKDIIINSSGKNMSPANIENALRLECGLLGSVVAIGDGRPYVTALVTLEPQEAAAFAAARGIAADGPEALSRAPEVREVVAAGIERGNARLSRVEQVRNFVVLPTFWEPNGDELTATMKVRRKVVGEKYAAEIEALYDRR